jgi:hypothetical protein
VISGVAFQTLVMIPFLDDMTFRQGLLEWGVRWNRFINPESPKGPALCSGWLRF